MKIPLVGKTILFAAGLLLPLFGGVSLAQNDAGEYAPPDTIFQEITLTVDGVTAVDTAGYDWYYDFELSTFTVGILGLGDDTGGPEDPDERDTDIVPVKERSSSEIKIKPVVKKITVGYDEFVEGDVIALGRVTIKGWVKGDVTSLNNRVLIASTGQVDGDVMAPEIIVKPGGRVLGEELVVKVMDPDIYLPDPSSGAGIIVLIVFTSIFLFFGFLIVTLLPKQTANFQTCLAENKLKAYFIGLFFMFLLPFIAVLVAITIVGIVLVPFVPFVYLFAILLGVVSFGDEIGRLVTTRIMGVQSSLLARSMIGIFVLMALWFFTAALMGSGSSAARGLGIFFLVVSICISTYPLFTGIGTSVMTRFGFKAYTPWKERHRQAGVPLTPAPPPIPKAPPEPTPGVFDDENEDETSG